jgi:hypothetical protein
MPKPVRPKPFVEEFFKTVGKGIYYGTGSIVGLAAQTIIAIVGEVSERLPIPSTEQHPMAQLREYLRGMQDSIPEDRKYDLVWNIVLLLVGIVMLAKTPMSIADTMEEKVITHRLNANIRPKLLDATDYLVAWMRGYISEEELKNKLAALGIPNEDIETLKRNLWYIPTASDVIRFGVREVYTPNVISKFQMDEGFDNVLANAKDDLQKAGLSEDTFRKYWRAHWELPSAQMGFAMLHRGIITKEELELLLTTLDIMPFWRDKVIQLSYEPYDRVDIRRMHKLGILKDADLVRAYMDLGYDEEKARKLAEFTIKYNEEPEESEKTTRDKEKEKNLDLTKSDILSGYRNGMIKKEDVFSMLQSIGYSLDEISYYIAREDFMKEQDMQEKYIKIFHDAYVKGIFTKQQVQVEFGKLNLPTEYQEYLFKVWDLEKSIKFAMPTKAEILGFFKRGIISKDIAVQELRKLGYSDRYISWYLSGVEVPTE